MAALGENLSPEETSHLAAVLQNRDTLSNGDRALADYIEILNDQKELRHDGGDLRALANKLKEKKGYGG